MTALHSPFPDRSRRYRSLASVHHYIPCAYHKHVSLLGRTSRLALQNLVDNFLNLLPIVNQHRELSSRNMEGAYVYVVGWNLCHRNTKVIRYLIHLGPALLVMNKAN